MLALPNPPNQNSPFQRSEALRERVGVRREAPLLNDVPFGGTAGSGLWSGAEIPTVGPPATPRTHVFSRQAVAWNCTENRTQPVAQPESRSGSHLRSYIGHERRSRKRTGETLAVQYSLAFRVAQMLLDRDGGMHDVEGCTTVAEKIATGTGRS